MPKDAAEIIGPAFAHVRDQLFRPFRLGQWLRLAVVSFLAGEMGGGSGCNFQWPGNQTAIAPSPSGATPPLLFDPAAVTDALQRHLPLVAVAVRVLIGLFVLFIYINSVCRFILYEAVVTRTCAIRAGWRRWRHAGWHYFLFQIVFGVLVAAASLFLVGVAFGVTAALGWWRDPRAHLPEMVLSAILLVFVGILPVMIVAAIVQVLTKDFVVPVMAAESVGVRDGWRRVRGLIASERMATFLYLLVKIGLAIAAAVITIVVMVIVVLILVVIAAVIGFGVVLVAKVAGLAGLLSNVASLIVLLSLAVLLGLAIAAVVSVPSSVFVVAYSIEFFMDRYPPLRAWGETRMAPPAVS